MELRDVPEEDWGGPWNGSSEHKDPHEVVWDVQAEGTFYYTYYGGTTWGTHGSWVFDDHGEVIVSGFCDVVARASRSS
jgi:hypothetical protein